MPRTYSQYDNPKPKTTAPNVAVTTGSGAKPGTATASDGSTVLESELDNYEQDIVERRDPTIAAVNRIIDLAESTDERNREAIEEFIGTSLPKLEALAAKANAGDYASLQALEHAYGNFEELAPPEMVAAAKTDPKDRARQLDAYEQQGDVAERYKALTGQEMTAQERYLLELNRREEEGGRRAAMQAQLRDLDARGARSGGAEMAALLGAQQTTSQNRSLQDLGAQAQVNDRAFRGLEGYGAATDSMAQTAGQMRDQGDVMSRFNQQQAQQWAQFDANYRADQQKDATGRARDLFDANTYTTQQNYGRGFDVYGAERDATAMKTGQYTQGADSITKAIEGGIGIDEARRAEAALKPKERKWYEVITDPADIF